MFSLDRLERVMDYPFDVELETYFIFDVDFGDCNCLTHQGFNRSDPANTPTFRSQDCLPNNHRLGNRGYSGKDT